MPLVRLLVTAAGRYEVATGELFVCTDEEFARWAPVGAVELVEEVEASALKPVEEEQEAAEAVAAKPKRAGRRTASR